MIDPGPPYVGVVATSQGGGLDRDRMQRSSQRRDGLGRGLIYINMTAPCENRL